LCLCCISVFSDQFPPSIIHFCEVPRGFVLGRQSHSCTLWGLCKSWIALAKQPITDRHWKEDHDRWQSMRHLCYLQNSTSWSLYSGKIIHRLYTVPAEIWTIC
jgi:hypothetical protein